MNGIQKHSAGDDPYVKNLLTLIGSMLNVNDSVAFISVSICRGRSLVNVLSYQESESVVLVWVA